MLIRSRAGPGTAAAAAQRRPGLPGRDGRTRLRGGVNTGRCPGRIKAHPAFRRPGPGVERRDGDPIVCGHALSLAGALVRGLASDL
jgi:hypothetical protein